MPNYTWFVSVMLVAGAVVFTGCKSNQPVEVVHSPRYEARPLSEPVDLDLPLLAEPASDSLGQYADAGGATDLPAQPVPQVHSAPVQPDVPATDQRVHVVQRGDTLWSIAVRHYNDGQMWQRIAAANDLTDGNKIREGQRLILP